MIRRNAVKKCWHDIVCDGCGMVLDPQPSAAKAAGVAREAGWRRTLAIDTCVECQLDEIMEKKSQNTP